MQPYPDALEDEVIRCGKELLFLWAKRDWIKISYSRDDPTTLSGDKFFTLIHELGVQASDPNKGVMPLDICEQALKDIEWPR